ncbi:MAG: hypothetical protein V7607_5095 [Solirubrobacteraceae bacterium]
MSTLLLLASEEAVVGRRAGLRDWLMARLRADSLDRELARGVAPETCGALTLRARRLIGPSARAALARQLRRVVSDARGGHVWMSRVPVRRPEVLDAADELDVLADRLAAPGPVDVRGVAQVQLLLTDGTGPLYFRGATEELRARVANALSRLDLLEQR